MKTVFGSLGELTEHAVEAAAAADDARRRRRETAIACVISADHNAGMLLAAVMECCAGGRPCADCRQLLRRAAMYQMRSAQWADALARGM